MAFTYLACQIMDAQSPTQMTEHQGFQAGRLTTEQLVQSGLLSSGCVCAMQDTQVWADGVPF